MVQGELDEVGGPAYISALVDGVPRSTNVEHYAKIIKEKSTLRNLIHSATKILHNAYDAEEEADTILEEEPAAGAEAEEEAEDEEEYVPARAMEIPEEPSEAASRALPAPRAAASPRASPTCRSRRKAWRSPTSTSSSGCDRSGSPEAMREASRPVDRACLTARAATPAAHDHPNQFSLLKQRRFAPFFWTQFSGAANDNLFKFAFTVMVTYQLQVAWLPPAMAGLVIGALFILPFLLFSVPAGALADRFDPRRIIQCGMLLFIVASAGWGYFFVTVIVWHGSAE